VTVEDTFNIAAAVDCAVGGKRASLDSPRLFQDAKNGWYYSITAGLDYTLTTALLGWPQIGSSNRRATIRSINGRARIVWTTDVQGFGAGAGANSWDRAYFENLDLVNTAATKNNSIAIEGQTSMDNLVIRGCTFTGFRSAGPTNAASNKGIMFDNEINGGVIGWSINTSNGLTILGNYVHNMSGGGLGASGNWGRAILLYNISANNTGPHGYAGGGAGAKRALHNLAYSNLGAVTDGFSLLSTNNYTYAGNLSTHNGRNGFNSGVPALGSLYDYNAYFSNAGGNYGGGISAGPNDSSADPGYLNAASANWGLGAALLNRGWTSTVPIGLGSSTITGVEPGPSQRLGAGGNFAY
jgi:hypothetical protein